MQIEAESTTDKSFKTPILGREVHNGSIIPKTKPFYERSMAVTKLTGHYSLLNITWKQQGISETEALKYNLNTSVDRKGGLIMPAELGYRVSESKVLTKGSDFRLKEYLEGIKGQGILAEISDPQYKRGIATETKVNKVKGLSKHIADTIFKIINTDIYTLAEEIEKTYIVKAKIKNFYPNDPISQMKCQTEADAQATPHQAFKGHWNTIKAVMQMKRRMDKEGVTQLLIRDMIQQFIPGIQPERKQATYKLVIQKLIDKGYEIIEEQQVQADLTVKRHQVDRDERIGKSQEDIKVHGKQGKYKVDIKSRNTKNIGVKNIGITDTGVKDTGVISDVGQTYTTNNSTLPVSNPTPLSDNQTPSNLPYTNANPQPTPFPSAHDLINSPILAPLPVDISPAALRDQASILLSADANSYISTLNEALSLQLLTYCPSDDLDSRQLAVMNRDGALPYLYRTLSSVSPRVYGQGVDNLFYCRKEMRLAAMEGLGFMDVDLENCHAQIALALWGDRLPELDKHISKGSLWNAYQHLFQEAGLTFYKSLIKAMHHATMLGGGLKAYKKACHVYNNHHPKTTINDTDFEAIYKVFIVSPFYKEIKSLFRWLSSSLDEKKVTLPTGETIIARKFRNLGKDKKGVMRTDEGNMLTVISGILQSVEVSIISYMIIRTHHLYVPILWQHDGLTIKSLYPNTVELMQEAVDEYCMSQLGRTIKLIGTNIS